MKTILVCLAAGWLCGCKAPAGSGVKLDAIPKDVRYIRIRANHKGTNDKYVGRVYYGQSHKKRYTMILKPDGDFVPFEDELHLLNHVSAKGWVRINDKWKWWPFFRAWYCFMERDMAGK